MLSRAVFASRNVVKAAPLTRRYGGVTEFKPPTMNDMPTPSGSWSENHSKKQAKLNMTLLFGIAFTAATIAAAKNSGLVELGLGPKIGK